MFTRGGAGVAAGGPAAAAVPARCSLGMVYGWRRLPGSGSPTGAGCLLGATNTGGSAGRGAAGVGVGAAGVGGPDDELSDSPSLPDPEESERRSEWYPWKPLGTTVGAD